jgi:hypothetical protein
LVRKFVFFSITFVINPEPIPMTRDATVNAMAKRRFITPEMKINPSGLISGDEVRNAMIGPQGKAVVSIPINTAVVPQAHKGVKAPKRTLAIMDTFFLLNNTLVNLSEFT